MTMISGQMRANLRDLLGLNDAVGITQQRLATGVRVQKAEDDPAAYFRAQGLSVRAGALENVNQALSLAMSNISIADKAMATMGKNLSLQLSVMRDALAAKPGAPAAAVNVTGTAAYAGGAAASLVTATPTDGMRFQNGDQFTVTITAADGSTRTAHFQAAAVPASPNGTGLAGGDPPTPSFFQFNTVAQLQAGLQSVLGSASISLVVTADNRLNLALGDDKSSVAIQQITDAGGASAGVTADLSQIFGAGGALTTAPAGQTVTFTPTLATTSQEAIDQRSAAADGYRTLLNQLATLARDAASPGYPNLLTGGTMTLHLSDRQDSTETVDLSQKLDVATLGFAWDDAAQTSADADGDFLEDAELAAAIAKVEAALQVVDLQQRSLGGQSSMLNVRLGFNKAFAGAMDAGADMMTAADMTTEAATLASQQTYQAFASNNLSITKAVEQSLLQILR